MSEDLWQVVLYLHLLSMAFFVGGQLFLAAVVVPVERRNPDQARTRATARRFGIGSAIALSVLFATGIAMADHYALWSSGTLQLKLSLIGALILLTLIHFRFPRAHFLHGVIFLLTLAIVWLGLDLT